MGCLIVGEPLSPWNSDTLLTLLILEIEIFRPEMAKFYR